MTAYALVRIKRGAKCLQGRSMYTWPPSDYCDEGRRLAGVSDDAVFIGKKVVGRNFRWDCKAPGAGMAGRYGNGSIFVYGDDCVEMLTPMLGYEPELPEQNAVNQKVSIDQKTPETIYLIPGEDVDGAPCTVWCDDPAPGEGMDPAEAVKYVRVDHVRERLFQGWPGCTDRACIVTGPRSGMGTNGGCHCMQNASRSQMNLLSQRLMAMMGGRNAKT